MSDTSQGTGWWQASDGKWYSPDLYPSDWPAPDTDQSTQAARSAETSAPPVEPESPAPDPNTPPIVGPGVVHPAPSVEPGPPSGWAVPDPAAGEPTLVEGIPPISTPDPTLIQPAVAPAAPPMPPPIAPTPGAAPEWSAPSAPAAAPAAWDAPEMAPPQPAAPPALEAPKAAGDAWGAMFGLVGGAALIVGSFLAWAKAGGTLTSGTVNGLTGSNGWGTLVAGLVAASCAGLLMAGVRKLWVGAAIVAAALTALALAIYSYIDIADTSDDLPRLLSAQEGVGADIANGALLDYDIGLWIVMAGAGVALVAGFVALARRQ